MLESFFNSKNAMDPQCDPYAPPRAEAPVEIPGPGQGWRIENGSLLVCDGAVLPGICMLGGDPGHPVERSLLHLHLSSGVRMLDEIRIEVFESRPARRRKTSGILASLLLGSVGGLISSVLMAEDGSATPASATVSCLLFVFGILGAVWQGRHLPRIAQAHDGWYRVKGITPLVLSLLKEVQDDALESDPP